MNYICQDVLIENADELATRHYDPLVTALQARVPDAFAQLHARYYPRLYKITIAITKNPDDAQDALQETFLRAHLSVDAFEGRSSIYSWLSRIAINCALMILRKRRCRSEVLFDPQPDDRYETILFEPRDPAPNPEETYDLGQRQIETWRAISRLDPQLQNPLRMQMKQRSLKEISEELNISEPAVKSRLYRARKKILTTRGDEKRFATHRRQALSASAGRGSLPRAINQGVTQT